MYIFDFYLVHHRFSLCTVQVWTHPRW